MPWDGEGPTDLALAVGLLPPLQFSFNGNPDELSPVLAISQDSRNPLECPLRESSQHILLPPLLASHGTPDTRYRKFCRHHYFLYALLTR